MNGSTTSYLKEIKRQHEEGTLSQEQTADFIVISLIDQALNGEAFVNRLDELEDASDQRFDDLEKSMDKRFDELEDKIDKAVEHQTDHPSLIYLLRFRTKQTIAALIFAFAIFTSWFVSGVRQPILEFFGLPIF
jgi:hypothetical protein